MSLFKKRGPDLIDLTDLQKRGILKENGETAEVASSDDGFVDFSSVGSGSSGGNFGASSQTSSGGMFGILDSLAGAGPVSENVDSADVGGFDSVSSLSSSGGNSFGRDTPNSQVEHVKVKVEDLEYKIDRLIERLEQVEKKFSN